MEWLLQWRELSKRPWLLRPVLEAEGEAFVCLGGDGEKESRTSPPHTTTMYIQNNVGFECMCYNGNDRYS